MRKKVEHLHKKLSPIEALKTLVKIKHSLVRTSTQSNWLAIYGHVTALLHGYQSLFDSVFQDLNKGGRMYKLVVFSIENQMITTLLNEREYQALMRRATHEMKQGMQVLADIPEELVPEFASLIDEVNDARFDDIA